MTDAEDGKAGTPAEEARYWCFISYSQTDVRVAARIQGFLENYRLPDGLSSRAAPPAGLGTRIRPVFRDMTHLPAAAQLSEALRAALRQSARLIVICSPAAAQSPWVADEIAYFLSLGRQGAVFPVVVAGEPRSGGPQTECLPAPIRATSREEEPLLVDLRGGQAAFKLGCLRLVAGLLGLSLDDLVRRDTRRRRRRMGLVGGAVAAAAVAAAGIGLRVAADDRYAAGLSEARVAATAQRYRLAETAIAGIPGWAKRFASAARADDGAALAASLGYRAGVVDLPPLAFNMELDGVLQAELVRSGDGKRLATREHEVGLADGAKSDWLTVFDRESGARVARIFGDIDAPVIALNRDGTVVAADEKGKGLVFRAIPSGAVIATVAPEGAGANRAFFDAHADRALWFSEGGGPVRLLDLSSGREIARVAAADGSGVKELAASNDPAETARHPAVLFENGELVFIDAASGAARRAEMPDGTAARAIVAGSSEDDAVLVATAGGKLALFRAGEPAPAAVMPAPQAAIDEAVILDGERIAYVDRLKPDVVVFLDPADPGAARPRRVPGKVRAMVASGGRRSVVVALDTGTLRLVADSDDEEDSAELLGESMPLSAMTVSRRHGLFAIGTLKGAWLVGDADAGVIRRQDRIGDAAVISIALSGDGRSLEIVAGDGRRERVELLPPRQVRSWPVPGFTTRDGSGEDDAGCPDMALAPAGDRVVLRREDGLAIYDDGGRPVGRFVDPDAESGHKATFQFGAAGRWLLHGHFGEKLRVIDPETGRWAAGPDYPAAMMLDARYIIGCPRGFEGGIEWRDAGRFVVRTIEGEEAWGVAAAGDGAPEVKLEGVSGEGLPAWPAPEAVRAPAGDREVMAEPGEVPVLRRRSDGVTVAVLDAFGKYVDRIAFNADGTRLMLVSGASGGDEKGRPNGGYVLLDAADGRVIREARGWIIDTSRHVFSPDGRYLLASPAGGADIGFRDAATATELVDAASGAVVAVLSEGFGMGIADARVGGYADHAFSADGSLLYAVRQSGRVDVWSLD